jgi:gliding motility-associated-like protein
MKKQLLFIVFILSLSVIKLNASHIIGGVVNYQHLGGDQYAMTIIIYRDCSSAAPFANPLVLNAFTIDGTLYDNFSIPNPVITTVEQPVLPPCAIAPTDVCVQQAVYQSTITLPPTQGGYSLMYTVCCRNGNILNIESPDNTSSSFVANLPADTSIDNSNAVFNEFPPTFICKDTPLSFNHSATDADGDSLSYSFCAPSDGVAIGGTASAPPYPDVNWVAGFDANNPIDASVPFQINPTTGLLTGTPNTEGRYVVGVCVSEYRNGVLITTTKRDFQFNVIACQNAIVSFPSLIDSCSGPTITFQNNSINTQTYFWDFGVPGIDSDTSNLFSPTFTYPDTGLYTVTLIAALDNGNGVCSDTVTGVYHVRPLLDIALDPAASQCQTGNLFNFNAGGAFDTTATFQWYLPGASGNQSSTSQNISSITYPSAGSHTVSLVITQYTCSDSVSTTFSTFPMPSISGAVQIPYCNSANVQFSATGDQGNVLWNFGTGNTADTSIIRNTSFTYPASGNYLASIRITNPTTGCSTLDTVGFFVPVEDSLVLSDMRNRQVLCKGDTLEFKANFRGGRPGYLLSWNNGSWVNNPEFILTTNQTQLFRVALRDSCGRKDSVIFQVDVPVYGPVELSLRKDTAICSYQNYLLKVNAIGGTNSFAYNWTSDNPEAALFAANSDTTTATFLKKSKFFVTVTDACNSTARDTIEIDKLPCDLNPPNVFTPNGDNSNSKFVVANLEYYPNTRLTVYDRWGNKKFETENYSPENTWDGSNSDSGVYYYIIQIPLSPPQTLNGFVHLLR